MVADQQFRSDLYYRLNVFPIEVPPLRERAEDIPLLVRHFVQYFAGRMKRVIETIPDEAMQALTGYSWPGNIRQLQNLIERATRLHILCCDAGQRGAFLTDFPTPGPDEICLLPRD